MCVGGVPARRTTLSKPADISANLRGEDRQPVTPYVHIIATKKRGACTEMSTCDDGTVDTGYMYTGRCHCTGKYTGQGVVRIACQCQCVHSLCH